MIEANRSAISLKLPVWRPMQQFLVENVAKLTAATGSGTKTSGVVEN
jgi:hypothetical protein